MPLSKPISLAPIRTFIAVEIPPPQRAVLATIIAHLQPEASLKLVRPELLHVTLRFLGPVAPKRLALVDDAARAAAATTQPFVLTIAGIGAFPNERAPRVVWAGLETDAGMGSLGALASKLEDALDANDFPRERRAFSPHITLARTRNDITPVDRRKVADAVRRIRTGQFSSQQFAVRQLIVMRSDQEAAGPRYTPLLTVPFEG